jgi:hypothetical protein
LIYLFAELIMNALPEEDLPVIIEMMRKMIGFDGADIH